MGLAHLASKDRATALRLRQRAGTRRRETRWREHHDRMHPTQHPVRPLPHGQLGQPRRGAFRGAGAASSPARPSPPGPPPSQALRVARPRPRPKSRASTIAADDAATGGTMQTTDPAQAVWPVVEEVEVGAGRRGQWSPSWPSPSPPSEIVATHDVDVVVCGLGRPAGDAAALACAEQGLKTVAVEKQNRRQLQLGHHRRHELRAARASGAWTYDTDRVDQSDAMIGCAFQGGHGRCTSHWPGEERRSRGLVHQPLRQPETSTTTR